MTAQEIFDTVVAHLRQQGRRCMNGLGYCYYRYITPDGQVLRCAAGALIPDDRYDPSMENRTWPTVYTRRKGQALDILAEEIGHEELIGKLQMMHDTEYPNRWEGTLKEIAEVFDLVYRPATGEAEQEAPRAGRG